MKDHLSREMLEGYRQRRLEPAELLEVDDHAAVCAPCRRMLHDAGRSRAAMQKLRTSVEMAGPSAAGHMSSRELRAYAAGKLDAVEAELAASHLEVCGECSGRMRALAEGESRWTWLSWGSRGWQVRFAAAVTAIVLVAVGVATWLRSRPGRMEVAFRPPEVSGKPSAPAMVLALKDGTATVTLDAEGKVGGLDFAAAADRDRVRAALTTQSIETPEILLALRPSSSVLMGGAAERTFEVLDPLGTVVVGSRPTLRWRALQGATGYQVTIHDPEAGYREARSSPMLPGTRWTVDRPLARGRVYSWQVTAQTPSGEVRAPAPGRGEARFQVLSQAQAEEIRKAEREYSGQPLLLGILYAEAGLVDKAEAALRAVLAANPESGLAAKLLGSVRGGAPTTRVPATVPPQR